MAFSLVLIVMALTILAFILVMANIDWLRIVLPTAGILLYLFGLALSIYVFHKAHRRFRHKKYVAVG